MVRRTKRSRMRTRRRSTRKTRVPRYRMKSSRPARRVGRTRSRVAAGYKRWKKYKFSRMTDLQLKNVDPELSSPEIQATTFSSPLTVTGNQLTPLVIDSTAPVADGCTNYAGAFIFKMNNLPNMAEFLTTSPPPAGLFEEYRLTKVCIEIVPTYAGKDLVADTEFTGYPATDGGFTSQRSYPTPTMYFIKDHDSTNSINWPMIAEMNGVNRIRLNKTHRIWVDPHVVVPVGGTFGGGSIWGTTRRSPWITNKDLGIQHYGLRFLIQDWPGPNDGVGVEGDAVPYSVRMNIRYFFECRGSM